MYSEENLLKTFVYDEQSGNFQYAWGDFPNYAGKGGQGNALPAQLNSSGISVYAFRSWSDEIVNGIPVTSINSVDLFFTTDANTYQGLTQNPSNYNPGVEVSNFSYIGLTGVMDSSGRLVASNSRITGFTRDNYRDNIITSGNRDFAAVADLSRSVVLEATSLTSQWFTRNLWIGETEGTRNFQVDFGIGSTELAVDEYQETLLMTDQGIFVASTQLTSTNQILGSVQVFVSDSNVSLIEQYLPGAREAYAAIPKTNFYLGTVVNDRDLLTGTIENEVFIPLGSFDTVMMGGGSNLLVLASLSGRPAVTDFDPASDKIFLDNNTFNMLSPTAEALTTENFAIGSPADSNDYIIYNQGSGGLFYDSDGNGATAAIQIAAFGLTIHPTLSASSFMIG
jgi:hypothetical protein